uniref:E2F/DP family winged-helix DNA-binding domain-containing protein n=1 Tax=Lates calcarifer TaxID=8187 RepID=A0A4W6DGW6_LATCA
MSFCLLGVRCCGVTLVYLNELDQQIKMFSCLFVSSLILNQTKEMIRTKKAVRQGSSCFHLTANFLSGFTVKNLVVILTRSGYRTSLSVVLFSDMSLGCLTQRFLEMLLTAPDGSLDLRQAMAKLQTRRQRVSDITNILHGISFIEKLSANRVKWIFLALFRGKKKLQRELENLKLVEDTLDSIIRTCRQQLFNTTNDTENSVFFNLFCTMAYVTHEDISRVRAFQDQTLFVVKAPEETKLEVSAPGKDRIQVRLRSRSGPIMVQTCDIRTGDGVTRETSGCFVTLAKSRIKMAMQHTGNKQDEDYRHEDFY